MSKSKIRVFKSGASRNSSLNKYDYEGFNHPLVDHSFAKYMHHHRKLEDGSYRDSDNWQKGIPVKELMRSFRSHVQDVMLINRGIKVFEDKKEVTLEEALNGVKFNLNAMVLDLLKNTKQVNRNEE